jgi:hypothetical protein
MIVSGLICLTKQYAIYDAIKMLLKTIFNNNWTPDSDRTKVYDLMHTVDEAIFFFSADEIELFTIISRTVENYLIAQKELSRLMPHEDDERATLAAKLNQHTEVLRGFQQNLPTLFAKALSFPSLEGRSPPV